MWIQKLTLGTASCRPQAPSFTAIVFQCSGGVRFGSLGKQAVRPSFVWIDSESDVTHGQLQAAGGIRLGKQFSESEARHGQLRRQPSFTAMVFQCSRGVRVGSLGKQFGASFLWIQKVTLGTASCRPQPPSFTAIVLPCSGGIRFGNLGKQFRASFAWIHRHGQLQAAGAICPSLPWCFSVAEGSVLGAWAPKSLPTWCQDCLAGARLSGVSL